MFAMRTARSAVTARDVYIVGRCRAGPSAGPGRVTATVVLMGPVARRRAARAGRMVLALGAALVLVWIGRRNASDLGRVHLRLDPRWLVAGLPFYALGSLWLAIGWRAELDAFGYRLPVTVAIRVWWRAQLARYVPTGLAAFASRAALARQEGVPASIGAASLALEL